MTNLMNRFRHIAGQNSLIKDDRGLSTVEYVIILVLIAAAAVGTWKTFGTTITTKINDSQIEINGANVKDQGTSNGTSSDSQSKTDS